MFLPLFFERTKAVATIDYITASLPFEIGDTMNFPKHDIFKIAMTGVKVPRYESGFMLACGALVAVPSEKNARQKTLFQMTGDACAMMRALEVEDTKMLQYLMVECKAKFARLDVAFDTVDPSSWAQRLLWEWRWKQVKTRIKAEPRFYQKEGGGETYYFGAEDSPRQLRVYDKAEELKLLAGIITRVELQSRDALAQQLAHNITSNNNLDWVAAKTIKDFIDFPQVRWYQELLQSGGVKVDKLGRKQTDFQKWWRNDIEDVFRNHYRDDKNGDRMFLRQSLQRMMDTIKKYDGQERE